jgi:phosphoribosylanthranilate isomerase
MVKVKICGITTLEDARQAIALGADALGFLVGKVHPSTGGFITAEKAREIIENLPPFCSTVLVTHLSRPREVLDTARAMAVNTIQLHGDTSPKEALEIQAALPSVKLYRVIHVFDEGAVSEAKAFEGAVDGIILDTAVKETGQVGGTGKTHDWGISRKIVEEVSLPVILAGGLTPENVREAIERVGPYAVDVHSGVTHPGGGKDYERMKSFIERAKSVATPLNPGP